MSFRIYCYRRVSVLLTLMFLMVSAPLFSNAQDAEFPGTETDGYLPESEEICSEELLCLHRIKLRQLKKRSGINSKGGPETNFLHPDQ